MSQRFVEMIMMQAEQVVMLLGLQPHPATGQTMRNLKAARFYIDQLEMLREKTRGNLVPEESRILSKMLGDLQYEYVRISGDLTAYDTSASREEAEPETEVEPAPEPAPTRAAAPPAPAAKPAPAPSAPASEAATERKVRFTKSYG
ncbi:MAG: DUF1844 domain-containing protein [Verrucomicrobia bacterium]|nr:DUF1844 domain-containing protein [Verrucomicrobiota bacterium]